MKPAATDQFTTARSAALRRVVLLNDSSQARGGATGLCLLLARQLRRQGLAVTLICGDAGDGGVLAADGIDVVAMGGKLLLNEGRLRAARNGIYNTSIRQRIAAYIDHTDTPGTVYHLHGWAQILSPSVFDALGPVAERTVLHAHDFFLACPTGSYFDFRRGVTCTRVPMSAGCLTTHCDKRAYLQKLWRAARQTQLRRIVMPKGQFGGGWARIVTLHEGMIAPLERAGLPRDRITVARNPARPMTQERVPAENNRAFGFIGRLQPGKGIETLCAAARAADVPLCVVGEGPLRAPLQARYPEVRFTGWVDPSALGQQLRTMRALVMPSLMPEPFGLVAAEASLSGVPVLVSDVALISEDVARLGLGLRVNCGRVEDLSAGLRAVRDLPAHALRRMSEAGFAKAQGLAQTPDAWTAQIQALYADALAEGTP